MTEGDGMADIGREPGRAWFLGAQIGDVKPCDEPDGWPEFEITLRFYVSSDDPAVIERERWRVFDALPDAVLEAAETITVSQVCDDQDHEDCMMSGCECECHDT